MPQKMHLIRSQAARVVYTASLKDVVLYMKSRLHSSATAQLLPQLQLERCAASFFHRISMRQFPSVFRISARAAHNRMANGAFIGAGLIQCDTSVSARELYRRDSFIYAKTVYHMHQEALRRALGIDQ